MTHEFTSALPDTDLTLPSVVATQNAYYSHSVLLLTVLFHPDPSRIGQVARVPLHDPSMPWVLGRRSPDFAHPGQAEGEPLHDPHVSRRAIEFAFEKNSLLLTRFEGSSRVRLGGSELRKVATLDREALMQGIPIALGHALVLFLRLGDAPLITSPEYPGSESLLGKSAAMQTLREQVLAAAQCRDDVLVRGETGTGKELVANAIHAASSTGTGQMVSVNMAAIPPELAPSMLFGSARGAFTGADKNRQGYFEQASGGTLFLDEIGDCPADIQPQLLRALQEREIQEVGGAIRRVDVRVISATDVPLEETAHFKAALLHRLGAVEIFLPPLRERIEDLGELVIHFAGDAARATGREVLLPRGDSSAVDLAAWALFIFRASRYHWPGNIRELANVVSQVVRRAPDALSLVEVFEEAISRRKDSTVDTSTPGVEQGSVSVRTRRMVDIADADFDAAMRASEFEPARVARELGVSRTAVYRRIEASQGYRLASDIPASELRDLLAKHEENVVWVAKALRVSPTALRQRLRALGGDES